jgi:outer membrane protein OmpA-like peptidoglycan-associated protein
MKICISVKNKPISLFVCNVLRIIPSLSTFLLLFGISFFYSTSSKAQIQWASAIKYCSIDNKGGSFSPQKILGQPNVNPQTKPQAEAWTVLFPEDKHEVTIELLFDEAIKVKKIFIAENLGIGLKNIVLKDEKGNPQDEYALNENYDLRLNLRAKISHVILYKPTAYLVKSLVITISPPFIGKSCQIDGVGIAETDITLEYATDNNKLLLPKELKETNTITYTHIKQHQTLAEQKKQPIFFPNREVSRYTLNGKFRSETEQTGNIKVKLVNQHTKDTLHLVTEIDGSFQIGLDDSEYALVGFQQGYLATPINRINTQGRKIGDMVGINVNIRTFKQGENYLFYEPIFDINSDSLDTKSQQLLQQLLLTLQENAKAVVRIEVHSDSRGDDQYNLDLTQKRADKIADYFRQYGIAHQRLIAKGLGETELRNRCANGVKCDNAAHLENRRIEIEIVELLD